MVRFALPFGAFTRYGQDSHKRDILIVVYKIEMISGRDLFIVHQRRYTFSKSFKMYV